MTLYQFRLLTSAEQLSWALRQGTYLSYRWEDVHEGVNLYHLPGAGSRGFFAEVGFDDLTGELTMLRSFSSSVPLEDYTHGVQLPGWLTQAGG